VIPRSIKELPEDWDRGNFRELIFDSASSLQEMIIKNKANLQAHAKIKFVDCDCEVSVPGYAVETVRDGGGLFCLVKRY
jgi:hypothetical protein